MPTYTSVQEARTKAINAGTNFAPNPNNEGGGKVRAAYFNLKQSGVALALGDVIELCTVPAGARILAIQFATDGHGGSCAVSFGDAGDPARLTANIAINAAMNASVLLKTDTGTSENPASGTGYEYSVATQIRATCTTVGSATAAVSRGHVLYAVN